MKESTRMILTELSARYPVLKGVEKDVEKSFEIMKECFVSGGTLYLCGNGGSSADCEHIAGELMKRFKKDRPLNEALVCELKKYGEEGQVLMEGLEGGLSVVSLCGHFAFSTAYQNDKNPMFTFAQQVNVWGRKGDVLLTLSTSGNSKNCVYASLTAKAKGMQVVALVGGNGGALKGIADSAIVAPEKETFKVQELHLPIYHCLCAMLEEELF